MTDLTIRGGMAVIKGELRRADLSIDAGLITTVVGYLPAGREDVDARGLVILPGVIDVHVHFNEPGRTEWEGAATGSRAFAVGGGTLFFDMPLNSTPCTIGSDDFDHKRAALEASSITDFGLWGGLIPGRIGDMAAMAARGVVGFKAFMADSGLPEFPRADDLTLLDGMREAARLGLPVAVHAESEEITQRLARQSNGRGVRDFLDSRPVIAELEAIQRALLFAAETGAALHIVHVSTGRGVALAAEARARGVDVSIETCPHYLTFTEDDFEQLGAVAKCAPPLRPAADRDDLWSQLLDGHIDIVASDHSPSPPSMKDGDVATAWGGIAGVQSTLAVLLESGHHARAVTLAKTASLLAEAPARRFRIAGKGSLAPGYDADLVLVDLSERFTLGTRDLQQRYRSSPYVGRSFQGRVRRTIRRGETIAVDGRITAQTGGRLVRPAARDASKETSDV